MPPIVDSGDPLDDHNHGTPVAGTIGAMVGNSIGVAGVMRNVSLTAVKFLNASGSGYMSRDRTWPVIGVQRFVSECDPSAATHN